MSNAVLALGGEVDSAWSFQGREGRSMMFVEVFKDVPDPRDCTAQHDLTEILFIALAAMLCGATHCTEMALFAQNRLELLRRFVPLPHGQPSRPRA